MNGAESLVRTLANAGVDVCFANPGTSEMHLVQAIDAVPEMRAVLALFEGVCSGAADGYARITGTPATTLLHLGPGLGNAIANLHNARRARTPLINLVGDHAAYHVKHDAPLTSDVEAISSGVSAWTRTSASSNSVAQDGADAVVASLTARPGSRGQIATLAIPADASWGESSGPVEVAAAPGRPRAESSHLESCARRIDADSILLVDNQALSARGMAAAGRIQAQTGCRLFSTTFPARVESGAGNVAIERMPYFPEQVLELLAGVSRLVLVGADVPVSFFAYRSTPSVLLPDGCEAVEVVSVEYDLEHALESMAYALGGSAGAAVSERADWALADGKLDVRTATQALGALLPEGAIVCTDSGPGGGAYGPLTRAHPHTWLSLTGGAIGQGAPVATGAAIAAPDRTTFALLGDGGAMYTNQALWTQAREGLNVVTVIYNNSRYNILDVEYHRLGVNEVGAKAASLFDLGNPEINWAKLAESQGVPGTRCTTADEFNSALAAAIDADGPALLEVML